MTKIKYVLKKGSRGVDKNKAQVYGEELNRIKESNGKLTSNIVLEEARNSRSKLHDYFEWDNSIAADKYRRDQAAYLMRIIGVVVLVEGKKTIQRGFFSIKTQDYKDGAGEIYVTIKEAIKTPSYRNQLLSELISLLETTTNTMKMFKSIK